MKTNKYKESTLKNNNGIEKDFKEVIEDFLHSDSIPATVTKFTLAFLALGGVAFVGALAPGLFSAMKPLKKSHNYSKKQLQGAIHTLKSRRLVEIIQEGDEKFKVQLTSKGKKRVKEFCFEAMELKRPAKWDKKWRILIFDIPTKPKIYNQARNALRAKIKDLGFYQMQKSVWVYPYECEDEILFITEIFQVQKHVEILTVEKLLHSDKLKKEFALK